MKPKCPSCGSLNLSINKGSDGFVYEASCKDCGHVLSIKERMEITMKNRKDL